MQSPVPRLVVVAHGTASRAGLSTISRIVDAVCARRPSIETTLCFLDVLDPRLADVLDDRPTVVVPLLLSTGFHVQADIPAAAEPHPLTRVAAHLGPNPLVIDALVSRLPHMPGAHTVLVAAGSRRPEAAAEVARAASLLRGRVGGTVSTMTMGDDLDAAFAAEPQPFRVATYLLAEGAFTERLASAVAGRGPVASPLGAHPALVELVWARYDEAAAGGTG